MTKKIKGNPRLDEALLEMAQDFRGTLLRPETADKITMRILGGKGIAKPTPLAPEQIRAMREEAHMSQSVFASLLNITTGYLSQLERGAKTPTDAAVKTLGRLLRDIDLIEPIQRPGAVAHLP